MPKFKFSDLDLTGMHAVFWLASAANTTTPVITASAAHVGEILEAVAFMREFPETSREHSVMAERLRLGNRSGISILDFISDTAPTYRMLANRTDSEIDELLAHLRNGLSC
jgi:hypothetical protein